MKTVENYTRAHIRFNRGKDVQKFVEELNSLGNTDTYMIENMTGAITVNARSYLGVIYSMTDFQDECYFVNKSNNGDFPWQIDKYRV